MAFPLTMLLGESFYSSMENVQNKKSPTYTQCMPVLQSFILCIRDYSLCKQLISEGVAIGLYFITPENDIVGINF